MNWFYYDLTIPTKQYKTQYNNPDKAPLPPKKPGSQPQKQKTLTSSNHQRAQYPQPKPPPKGARDTLHPA